MTKGEPFFLVQHREMIDSGGSCFMDTTNMFFASSYQLAIQWIKAQYGFQSQVVGVTPQLSTERGIEIQTWMTEHDVMPWQIVILDDDSDMAHLKCRHVKTTFANGLTENDAIKAIHLLTRKDTAQTMYL